MAETIPCDLHVLSMPPAFALSQDQTLRFINPEQNPRPTNIEQHDPQKTCISKLHQSINPRYINKHHKDTHQPNITCPQTSKHTTPNQCTPKQSPTTIIAVKNQAPPTYPFQKPRCSCQGTTSFEELAPAGSPSVKRYLVAELPYVNAVTASSDNDGNLVFQRLPKKQHARKPNSSISGPPANPVCVDSIP